MKEKIRKIHSELNDGRITVSQATEQVLDLLAVSKRHLLESILEDMNSKHTEYHREVVESYLDDGC